MSTRELLNKFSKPNPRNWSWMSMRPERHAEAAWADFVAAVTSFERYCRELEEAGGEIDVGSEVERFATKHYELHSRLWAAIANTASPMVTGGSNFDTARNAKALEREGKIRREVEAHIERAKKAVKRRAFPHGAPGEAIRSNDPDAIAKLTAQIAELERLHKLGLEKNREWAKTGEPGDIFPPYFADSGRAKIRRLKKRLAELESAKAVGTESERLEIGGIGVEVVRNTEAMRLQLIFDEKPDAELRQTLKRGGWRWSPKAGAWQRHLNAKSELALRQLTGANDAS